MADASSHVTATRSRTSEVGQTAVLQSTGWSICRVDDRMTLTASVVSVSWVYGVLGTERSATSPGPRFFAPNEGARNAGNEYGTRDIDRRAQVSTR